MSFDTSLDFARKLDSNDELKHFRNRFIIPEENGKEQVYFLGNSLGLQPKTTAAAIQEVLDQWASFGVEGFFKGRNPWLQYHDQLTQPLGNIVGALPSEICSDEPTFGKPSFDAGEFLSSFWKKK